MLLEKHIRKFWIKVGRNRYSEKEDALKIEYYKAFTTYDRFGMLF